MQGSASALGARSVQCRPLLIVKQVGEIDGRGAEMGATQVQRPAAVTVCKKSEVADLHETCRQRMEQEATDELDGVEPHHAAAVVVPGVAPAKAHLSVFEAEQPSVGDGDAMGISSQIFQHMSRSAEGRLRVDDPVFSAQASEQRVKGAGHG